MMNVTMIAAVGKNLELGKDNKLLWHLPEDLKFFKEQTMGKPIIMGKKTLDSLPRLLPGRLHLVLTHQQLEETDQIKVFRDIDSLLEFIKSLEQEVMVIGGAQVYKQMLDFSDKMILTEVDAETTADVYFPTFDKNDWDQEVLCEHQHEEIKYKHLVYTRKK